MEIDPSVLERELCRIPDVYAVRVAIDDAGEPSSARVLAGVRRTPKRVRKDVQSVARASFGVDLPPGVISVTQMEDTGGGAAAEEWPPRERVAAGQTPAAAAPEAERRRPPPPPAPPAQAAEPGRTAEPQARAANPPEQAPPPAARTEQAGGAARAAERERQAEPSSSPERAGDLLSALEAEIAGSAQGPTAPPAAEELGVGTPQSPPAPPAAGTGPAGAESVGTESVGTESVGTESVVVESVGVTTDGRRSEVLVALRRGGAQAAGRASGTFTPSIAARSAATATLEALKRLGAGGPPADVESAGVATAGDAAVALVVLASPSDEVRLLAGSAMVRGAGDLEAVARAVLDAVEAAAPPAS